MTRCLSLIIFSSLLWNLNAQNIKKICDDTLYLKTNEKIYKKLDLPDLLSSKHDFYFRFKNYGQIIDIWMDQGLMGGTLTNYRFKTKKNSNKDSDTIYLKQEINQTKIAKIYNIINDSKILELKTDIEIEGWKQGYDGITYCIEYTNKDEYHFKKYWNPETNTSLKEAIIVSDFINKISGILELEESKRKFESKFSATGCYKTEGMLVMCYLYDLYSFGYSGSTRLPLGYEAKIYFGGISNIKTNLGLSLTHQFDSKGSYDISTIIGYHNLFIKSKKSLNNYLSYGYRIRKLKYIDNKIKWQNHSLLYRYNIKDISLGLGANYLIGRKKKVGGAIYADKSFSQAQITIASEYFIYNKQFDYKISLSKRFRLYAENIHNISIGLYYESFLDKDNIGWKLNIYL